MAGKKMIESLKAERGTSTPIEGFVHFELVEHGAANYAAVGDGGITHHHGMVRLRGRLTLNDDIEADALVALATAENLIHHYRASGGGNQKETLKNAVFSRPATNIPRLYAGGNVGETVLDVDFDVAVTDTPATMRVVAVSV